MKKNGLFVISLLLFISSIFYSQKSTADSEASFQDASFNEEFLKGEKTSQRTTGHHFLEKTMNYLSDIVSRYQPESTTIKQGYYQLEEIPSVIERLNQQSNETEKLTNPMSYTRYRYKDERLPPWEMVLREFMKRNSVVQGVSFFIFNVKPPSLDVMSDKLLCAKAFVVH